MGHTFGGSEFHEGHTKLRGPPPPPPTHHGPRTTGSDLVLWRIVDNLRLGRVVRNVEFETVVRPRREHHWTALIVEREVLDVQR